MSQGNKTKHLEFQQNYGEKLQAYHIRSVKTYPLLLAAKIRTSMFRVLLRRVNLSNLAVLLLASLKLSSRI